MVKVYSPIDRDHEFTRNNEKFVLKANAETELPLAVAAHAVRTLGHLGVMQLRHPNDVARAERKHTESLRMDVGRVRNIQGTVSASVEGADEAERHEAALARRPAVEKSIEKVKQDQAADLPQDEPKAKKPKAKTEAQPAPKE